MSWWNAKYKNDHGEYEITFGSKYYEKTKAVEKFCQAIIDKKINENNAADILERIIKADNVTDTNVGNKWISVKERLPEYDRKVLIADTRYGLISIAELRAGGGALADYWECEDGMSLPVIEIPHWIPLPEPLKEDAG